MHPTMGFALLAAWAPSLLTPVEFLLTSTPRSLFTAPTRFPIYISVCATCCLKGKWYWAGLQGSVKHSEVDVWSWSLLAYFVFFGTNFLWHRCYLKLRSHSPVTLGTCCFWSVFSHSECQKKFVNAVDKDWDSGHVVVCSCTWQEKVIAGVMCVFLGEGKKERSNCCELCLDW